LTESHWEARLISPFRGLSLAVKSLATGVYFLATAIFSQKVFSNGWKGIKAIGYSPVWLLTGIVGLAFINCAKSTGIMIRDGNQSNMNHICLASLVNEANSRENHIRGSAVATLKYRFTAVLPQIL
jgi:hypothetical protein